MRTLRLALTALALMTASALGDVVNLTDGTKLEGKIRKTDAGWAITQTDGTVVTITSDKVASIEASPAAPSPSAAMDQLNSVRRVVDHLSDINEIINRYNKFLQQTTDPDATAAAQKDLQMWQDRLNQGLVKLGDRWIGADERQRRRDLAQSEAVPARDLIIAYRYQEADKLLQQALLDDPECATALYLQGVMNYKQEQVRQARTAFEQVNQLVQDHAPTLNNLAVVAWRQKSFVVCMNYYNQAMMAAPQAKEILDNVAEALNVVPDENKNAPVVVQAARLFAEQDALLQKAAAEQGMFRWGATWVSAKELDELKADEAKIKQQLDDLQKQFDALQQQKNEYDAQISANQIELDRLQAQSTYVDRNGNVIQMQLPDAYYQLQRDSAKLVAQKQGAQQQQDDLKRKAKQVQQDIPVPKFTGLQQIIGAAAMPVRAPSATTEPSN